MPHPRETYIKKIVSRDASHMKRIVMFLGDWQDSQELRHKQAGVDILSFQVVPVANWASTSLRSCEEQDARYERRDVGRIDY